MRWDASAENWRPSSKRRSCPRCTSPARKLRTTSQIHRWAESCLARHALEDLDGRLTSLPGYTSLRQGPEPLLRAYHSKEEAMEGLLEYVLELLQHAAPGDICLMAPSRGELDRYQRELESLGVPALILAYGTEPGSAMCLSSMRREGETPLSSAERNRYRRLVYAAASRARDTLFVCAMGPLSALFPEAAAQERTRRIPAEETMARRV